MSDRCPRQRGFALLIVLWTLALLALLGSTVLATARQDAQQARNQRDAAVLQAAAHGAMQQAIFWLLDNSNRHWPADDVPHPIRIGPALVVVRIQDENDKVNPNIASSDLLRALLVQVGANPMVAASVADAIVAWRLGGGGPGRPNATTALYAAAGRAYAPSGAPFGSLDELGNVLGMTPELLLRLRPHLTLFTDDDPDAGTRDPVVARALAAIGESSTGAGPGGPQVVSITADAQGAGAARFAEREIVRSNTEAVGQRYEVLDYERFWND
jgi:general secretion pathway protein K